MSNEVIMREVDKKILGFNGLCFDDLVKVFTKEERGAVISHMVNEYDYTRDDMYFDGFLIEYITEWLIEDIRAMRFSHTDTLLKILCI